MNFIQPAQLAAGFSLGVIITAAVFSILKKHTATVVALETEAYTGQTARSAIDEFRKSKEFKLIKKSEYDRGFRQGAENTMNDFQIQYQKFENIDEKFFSSIIETGYFMQLTYRGLPVGDITKRVIHAGKKVDKKRVDDIINRLNDTVNSLVQAAAAGKIPVKEVKHLITRK